MYLKGDKGSMEELKQKLLQAVNESGLPLDAIYYVSKDFFRDVDDTYKDFLQQKKIQQQQNEENKQEEEKQ